MLFHRDLTRPVGDRSRSMATIDSLAGTRRAYYLFRSLCVLFEATFEVDLTDDDPPAPLFAPRPTSQPGVLEPGSHHRNTSVGSRT